MQRVGLGLVLSSILTIILISAVALVCFSNDTVVNIGHVNTIVLYATLIVLIWYTYFTSRISQTATKQLQLLQEPVFNLFITSHKEDPRKAVILYRNFTNNAFYDLKVKLQLNIEDKAYVLSKIFDPEKSFYFGPRDSRNFVFDFPSFLREHGMPFDALSNSAPDVRLSAEFSYTSSVLNKRRKIAIQQYYFSWSDRSWHIRL